MSRSINGYTSQRGMGPNRPSSAEVRIFFNFYRKSEALPSYGVSQSQTILYLFLKFFFYVREMATVPL